MLPTGDRQKLPYTKLCHDFDHGFIRCTISIMNTITTIAVLLFATLTSSVSYAESALAIVNCTVFNPEAVEQPLRENRTILIRGDRIVAIWGPGEPNEIPPDAKRIDGRGKFALPGLIDAHVHLVHVSNFSHVTGDELLPLFLAAGVTSVRSTGDEIVAATLVARFAQKHPETSPRVFTCSPLLDGSPPFHPDAGRPVTNVEAVPAVIADLMKWNISTLKIYVRTSRGIGKAIIDEGHKRGLTVTAHLGSDYRAIDAVKDGLDCVEHITSVMPITDELVTELKERGTFVDPTLVVFRNMIHLCDDPSIKDRPGSKAYEHVPQRLRDFWPVWLAKSGCPQPAGHSLAARQARFASLQDATRRLHKNKVRLLVGTDAPEPQVAPGVSLHQELKLLVESGLSPAEALTAATLNNAKALRQETNLGTIESGKFADILLLTANPLEDITNTQKIDIVIRGGIVTRPDEVVQPH